MSGGIIAGAALGLRRAIIPIVIAAACFLVSFWAIDDMGGLIRGIGWICVALSLLLVGINAWHARSGQAELSFKHQGHDDGAPGRRRDA